MKKVLIVVDMQNDFVSGSLGTSEAQAIVRNVAWKIEKLKSEGYEVIFTRDTHLENYLETSEGKKLPVEHCIRYTWGWEIVNELNTENCIIIDKPTFGYNGWEFMLSEVLVDKNSGKAASEDPEKIELIGLCTDICVVSNALILKALYPDADITVDASCCAGVTPESHNAALTTMKMCQINVIGG